MNTGIYKDGIKSKRVRVHTVKMAIYICHVEAEELNDGFVYEKHVGANESYPEYGLPAARDISRKRIIMMSTHCLSAVSTEMRITTSVAFSWSIALRIALALCSRRTGAYA